MKPAKAMCKNCHKPIEWMQGLGWAHLQPDNTCTKPVPVRDTIQ
jgi:hypothetical protein